MLLFFLIHRLFGFGSGVGVWAGVTGSRSSLNTEATYLRSYGFVLGVLGFFLQGFRGEEIWEQPRGERLEFGTNRGPCHGLIGAFQIVLAMNRGFKSFNFEHL
jgi:hypothetical protein